MLGPRKLNKGRRILLVDDDPDNVRIFTIALHDRGFEVHTFEDPQMALSTFKPNYYDLSILDIRMPKMDGYELYGKIRRMDHKIKICFLTASEADEFKTRFSPTFCTGMYFIRKPITIDDLANKVNGMM